MRHKHADLLIYAAENNDAEFTHSGLSAIVHIGTVCTTPDLDWKIKPKTETRWQWAYRYDQGDEWFITTVHYTAYWLKLEGLAGKEYTKLEFTAKEFEI